MSNELFKPGDTDAERVTEDLVRVHATRRVRQAVEISQPIPSNGVKQALLYQLGLGAQARAERQIRDDQADANVQAMRVRNRALLEMQKALDGKAVEEFKARLAILRNGMLRTTWSLEAAATLNALDELACQIDRAEERVASIRSAAVRKGVMEDVNHVYARMRTKLRELLPEEAGA